MRSQSCRALDVMALQLGVCQGTRGPQALGACLLRLPSGVCFCCCSRAFVQQARIACASGPARWVLADGTASMLPSETCQLMAAELFRFLVLRLRMVSKHTKFSEKVALIAHPVVVDNLLDDVCERHRQILDPLAGRQLDLQPQQWLSSEVMHRQHGWPYGCRPPETSNMRAGSCIRLHNLELDPRRAESCVATVLRLVGTTLANVRRAHLWLGGPPPLRPRCLALDIPRRHRPRGRDCATEIWHRLNFLSSKGIGKRCVCRRFPWDSHACGPTAAHFAWSAAAAAVV